MRLLIAIFCLLFNWQIFALDASYQKLNLEVDKLPLFEELKQNTKPKLLVFFSYACTACRALHPELERWSKSQPNLELIFLPIPAGRAASNLAKAYLLLEHTPLASKLNPTIFHEIHDNKTPLWLDTRLKEFFAAHNLAENFKQEFYSEAIAKRLAAIDILSKALKVDAVPTCIVLKPKAVYLTDLAMTRSLQALTKVLEELIKLKD